jgi:hypothetical protein
MDKLKMEKKKKHHALHFLEIVHASMPLHIIMVPKPKHSFKLGTNTLITVEDSVGNNLLIKKTCCGQGIHHLTQSKSNHANQVW